MKNGYLLDARMRAEFGKVLRGAECGELLGSCGCRDGILPLVIVLDRFSRHAYSNTLRAYANDMATKMVLTWAWPRTPT